MPAIMLFSFNNYIYLIKCTNVASFSFGVTCQKLWKDEKPLKHLNWTWFLIRPLLFGTVGATIIFEEIRLLDFGYSLIIITVAAIIRFITVILVSLN